MRKAFVAALPADSAIIDGESCLVCAARRKFWQLMSQMCKRWPDESRLMFLAFDLLHQDGVDLRRLSLTQRKRDLDRLCRGGRVPYLHQVEVFAGGELRLSLSKWLARVTKRPRKIGLGQRLRSPGGRPTLAAGNDPDLENQGWPFFQTVLGVPDSGAGARHLYVSRFGSASLPRLSSAQLF